jgi:HD-GYP domain-containing protein (c-di-GMP phosphodiesterase class II)/DNA-binding CsgD family transcriptional regulator
MSFTRDISSSASSSVSPVQQTLGALAFAGDLTMGQPVDHSPRTALLAYHLGIEAGWAVDLANAGLMVALLRWAGCTSNAQEFSHLFGDDIQGRANLVQGRDPFVRGSGANENLSAVIEPLARAHCEVALQIAYRLGMPILTTDALGDVLERWDGSGYPNRKVKEQIHPAAQLVALAGELEIATRFHGVNEGLARVRRQAAQLFDPSLLNTLNTSAVKLLASLDARDAWEACTAVLSATNLAENEMSVDNMTALLADYAELKIPRCVGASELAAQVLNRAARNMGLDKTDGLLRAARLHGLGRVSVANATLDRNANASINDLESIRLSPYWAARILSRCPILHAEAQWIMRAYERSDGAGFPFGLATPGHDTELLLLQAVVAYVERVKPWRLVEPVSSRDALHELQILVSKGSLDGRCVDALSADNIQIPSEKPSSSDVELTSREREVLQQLCHGLSNKHIAKVLDISPKTVGTHIEHLYAKLAVSTRAAATMKALQWGLVS